MAKILGVNDPGVGINKLRGWCGFCYDPVRVKHSRCIIARPDGGKTYAHKACVDHKGCVAATCLVCRGLIINPDFKGDVSHLTGFCTTRDVCKHICGFCGKLVDRDSNDVTFIKHKEGTCVHNECFRRVIDS
jgi:hypothetical protein